MEKHIVDQVSLGAIVQVRDRLLAQQAKGRRVLRLESGDPSFSIPVHVREAIEKALLDGHTHYTASTGIPELRKAILNKITTENHLVIPDDDHVVVTNGGMHGLYVLFRAILDPGDEVILPDPMWTEIAENIRLGGGVPVPIVLREENGYQYDPAEIEASITSQTKAIFINSPQNPVGAVTTRETLEEIVKIAVNNDLLLVSDEAYEHVIFDGNKHISLGSLPGAENRTISVFSMSKSYAMSGLRMGYLAITDDHVLDRVKKLIRCTVNGINSATQYGAAAALNGPQHSTYEMAGEYNKRRDLLFSSLEKSPHVKPFKPGGSFFIWTKVLPSWPGYQGKKDDWSVTNYLIDQAGIGSSPGSAFSAHGSSFIRFAFSCSSDQIEEASRLLPELFQNA